MSLYKLLSLGSTSAAEGFGSVFIAAACGLGALALMYAVLVIMNRIHDKQEQEKSRQEEKAGEEGTTQKEEKTEEKNGV